MHRLFLVHMMRRAFCLLAVGLALAAADRALATTDTFNHGAGTDEWAGTPAKPNWSTGLVPATTVETVVDTTYDSPVGGAFTLSGASITTSNVVFNTNKTLSLSPTGNTATARTFTLDGTSPDFSGATAAGGSSGDLILLGTNASNNTITIGGTNTSAGNNTLALKFTASGNIDVKNGGATLILNPNSYTITNAVALNKTGSGTLVLGKQLPNAIGGLTITAGTVRQGTTLALNNTPLTLAGGTFDTGGLAAANSNASPTNTATLTLSASSKIDLGAAVSSTNVRFVDSSAIAWTGGAVLTIADYTIGIDHFFVGTSATGLTALQLAQIKFLDPDGYTAGTYNAVQLSTGEIMFPEPGSGVLLLVSAGWILRRSSRRGMSIHNKGTL